MSDVVEMNISRAVAVTNTTAVRTSIQERIDVEGLAGPPVELMRFHVFILCTNGTGQHMVDFEDHAMAPGTAIWIRPGQVQRWSNVEDEFDADVVVFHSSCVPDLPLFDHFLGETTIAQVHGDAARLKHLIGWAADDLEANNDHATTAAVVGVILRLFARHIEVADPDETAGRRLASAYVESVNQHIEQRSVSWHARQIGASTRSVARATAETLGQQPKEVIDARVILEAQRRLAWSNEDIATISRRLRFSEPSNFTKFFRARTGTSPSDFRLAMESLATTATGLPPGID